MRWPPREQLPPADVLDAEFRRVLALATWHVLPREPSRLDAARSCLLRALDDRIDALMYEPDFGAQQDTLTDLEEMF